MNNPHIDIGADIVEVKRFRQKPLKTNPNFYRSIFTTSELMYCLKFADPYPHLAGIFAAKEAVIKCFDGSLMMNDVEIVKDIHDKPKAIAHYKKKEITVKISVSHTQSLAIAVATIIL
jgi:phosphopantetheine--protein transferase-like protein